MQIKENVLNKFTEECSDLLNYAYCLTKKPYTNKVSTKFFTKWEVSQDFRNALTRHDYPEILYAYLSKQESIIDTIFNQYNSVLRSRNYKDKSIFAYDRTLLCLLNKAKRYSVKITQPE